MTDPALDSLAALIQRQRHALLLQWRVPVRELPGARDLNVPTLNDHIPELLEELATAFQSQSEQTIAEVLSEGSPLRMVNKLSTMPLILKRSSPSTTSCVAAFMMWPTRTA